MICPSGSTQFWHVTVKTVSIAVPFVLSTEHVPFCGSWFLTRMIVDFPVAVEKGKVTVVLISIFQSLMLGFKSKTCFWMVRKAELDPKEYLIMKILKSLR